MDFRLSSVQVEIRERARQLLAEFSTDHVRDAEVSADGFPRALWEAGIRLGWPKLSVPAEFGGGGGLLDLCVALEETGRAGATLPLVGCSGTVATMLQRAPAGDHRDRLLQEIASGTIVAPALIDEDGRNEWDDPRIELQLAGDDFVLSGTKVLVPFASVADELLITAVTAAGESAIVAVEAVADGVTITRHHSKVGVPLASVTLSDVHVSSSRIIQVGDDARASLEAGLHAASLLASAEAVGMCEALVTMTAEHATQRSVFGRPLGTFQAVSHPCADMRVSVDAIRILVQQAAWLVDNGHGADEEIPATKALANEHFERVSNDAYRLHGALGFSTECDVQLYTRRLQGFFGSFGETQECYERAAAAVGMS